MKHRFYLMEESGVVWPEDPELWPEPVPFDDPPRKQSDFLKEFKEDSDAA